MTGVEEQLHDLRRHCSNIHAPAHRQTHQRDQTLPSRPPTLACGGDDGDVVHVFQERLLLRAASNMVLNMPFLSRSALCVLESKRLWEANPKKC